MLIRSLKKNKDRGFPGGSAVRTWCFHCWAQALFLGSIPGQGTKNHKTCGVAKKKKKKINYFGKVSGHKINAQNYLIFLYTNSKRSEREIKETTPLLFHQKNKIPRNKPT